MAKQICSGTVTNFTFTLIFVFVRTKYFIAFWWAFSYLQMTYQTKSLEVYVRTSNLDSRVDKIKRWYWNFFIHRDGDVEQISTILKERIRPVAAQSDDEKWRQSDRQRFQLLCVKCCMFDLRGLYFFFFLSGPLGVVMGFKVKSVN